MAAQVPGIGVGRRVEHVREWRRQESGGGRGGSGEAALSRGGARRADKRAKTQYTSRVASAGF